MAKFLALVCTVIFGFISNCFMYIFWSISNNTQSDILLALQRRLEVLEEQTAVQKILSRSNTQVEVLIDLQRRLAVVEEHNDIKSDENISQPDSILTPILGKRSRYNNTVPSTTSESNNMESPTDVSAIGGLTFTSTKRFLYMLCF